MHRRTLVLGAGGVLGSAALASAALAGAHSQPLKSKQARVELLSTYVAGTAYHGAKEARALKPGVALELRRRPDSTYDARTVEVWTPGGAKLGVIPRIDNKALASLMDAGFEATARVRSVSAHPSRPAVRLDISMSFARA